MNLTPEETAVGKENFHLAIGSPLVRRDFLAEGIAQRVTSGGGLGPYYFGYDTTLRKRVRVGVIGTGDEGGVLIGAINPDFIQVTAIADIRPYSRYRAFHGDSYSEAAMKARPGLLAKYGWKTEEEAKEHVHVYGDYRDLLKHEKDVEAVIIALPLHLHAEAAIAALRAEKHVLTEKLMGHSVRECKEMARVAAQQTGLHLATGHQRHNILYDNAVQIIRKGLLGDLHYIRAQWHRGNMPGKDSWQQPLPQKAKPDDLLAQKLVGELRSWQRKLADVKKKFAKREATEEEVALWQKRVAQKEAQISDEVLKDTAKDFDYEDMAIRGAGGEVVYNRPAAEELIRWRLWNRTGGGLMAELGSHQLDAASIFISAMHEGKKQYPLNVVAAANRPIFPPDRDVDDHVYCLFEFPAPGYDPNDALLSQKKIGVAYASINGNGFGGYGETVFGTEGTLILGEERDTMLYKTSATSDHVKVVQREGDQGPAAGIEIEVEEPDDEHDEQSAAVGRMALVVAERGYTEQLEHWAWCIRNPAPENLPKCHPKVALADAVIALSTNIAAAKAQRIEFDPRWFDPDRDETPEGEKPDLSRYA